MSVAKMTTFYQILKNANLVTERVRLNQVVVRTISFYYLTSERLYNKACISKSREKTVFSYNTEKKQI